MTYTGDRVAARTKFRCPICEHPSGVISERVDGWFWVICFACRDVDGLEGGEWLRAVVAKTDAPNGGELLRVPHKYLETYVLEDERAGNGVSRRKEPEPLPGWKQINEWQFALRALRHRLSDPAGYLVRRGIGPDIYKRWNVGYTLGESSRSLCWKLKPFPNYPAFTLPVYDGAGALTNVMRRFYNITPTAAVLRDDKGKEIKYLGLRGHPSALYPDIPAGRSVLLVAGMFDALLGRAKGLPTVTATSGNQLPSPLAAALVGKHVAVMFDVGEERAAQRAVRLLWDHDVRAWFVPNRLPEQRDDLTDWFVKYDLTREWLLNDIRKAKRRS